MPQRKSKKLVKHKPSFSVNLVTWNAMRFLPACLKSVLAQSYANWSLCVVDNGSTDETVAYIKQHAPKAKIISHKANTGFAPAHNEAIRATNGAYVMLLNQDVVLDKDFLKRAAQYFNQHPEVAAIQPHLNRYDFTTGKDLGIIDTTGLLIYKNRRIVNRGQGKLATLVNFKEGEIFGPDGAAPIYRRAALEQVKLAIPDKEGEYEYLDEDFFAYKEDVDLAWRLRLAGLISTYVPNLKAFHGRGSGDSASVNPVEIVRERRKIGAFAKTLSWRNQRLMQIKDEQVINLVFHLPWLLGKEILAWAYVLIFEPETLKSLPKMLALMPRAFMKRRQVKELTTVTAARMRLWFV